MDDIPKTPIKSSFGEENPDKDISRNTSTNGNQDGLSATGANPGIPEMSAKSQAYHRHHLQSGGCFSGMPMEAYVEKGAKLARRPVGGDVEGYRGEDGCIVRFNKKTGEWVKAFENGVVSYMKPSRGRKYYLDCMTDDGGETYDEC